MGSYNKIVVMKFALKVFPGGRILEVGSPSLLSDLYDFILVENDDQIERYYDHLSEGGIIAGEGDTRYFGDDIIHIEGCWMHSKPAKGNFPYKPVVITIERAEHAYNELSKWGIKYDTFNGIRTNLGQEGLALSMIEVFRRYKGDVMIFEDDIKFLRNPHTFSLKNVPNDWDAVYLGANIKTGTDEVNKDFSRLISAWTTHAVLYRRKFIEKILSDYKVDMAIDEWINRLMPELNVYITNPFYATQIPGWSLIEKKEIDYSVIFNSQKYLS